MEEEEQGVMCIDQENQCSYKQVNSAVSSKPQQEEMNASTSSALFRKGNDLLPLHNYQQQALSSNNREVGENSLAMAPIEQSMGLSSSTISRQTFSLSNGASRDGSLVGTISSIVSQHNSFQCEWQNCGELFTVVESFVEHVNGHVRAETSPDFHCRWHTCKRKEPFNAHYMLVQHVRKHSGEKPFHCEFKFPDGTYCDKRYSRMENKKTHERSHNGERPFQCAHCTKTFTNVSDKAKHQNRTHKQSKDFHCPVLDCYKQYTDPSSLRKHVCREHGEGVWNFIKKIREENGARMYSVNLIGIDHAGAPYLLVQQQPSVCNEEEMEVDVVN